jgi:hypothetical protein
MEEEQRRHYEAVLHDLLARRRELDATIAVLRRAIDDGEVRPGEPRGECGAPEPGGGLASPPATDAFFGMSIADAARKYLRLRKRKAATAELAQALEQGGLTHASENFVATVSAILSRESRRAGEIVKVARGEWGLSEWYPGLRQKRPLPAPPREVYDPLPPLPDAAPGDDR